MEKIKITSKHASEVVWRQAGELSVFILALVTGKVAWDSGKVVRIALLAAVSVAIVYTIWIRFKHETDK